MYKRQVLLLPQMLFFRFQMVLWLLLRQELQLLSSQEVMRDEEVIKAADDANLAMAFTGIRHFRH